MVPADEVIRQRSQEVFEREPPLGLLDEDVASPAADLGFGQAHVLLLEMLEVPAARNLF
ncbi:hypothetical protein D9M68_985070 [compost metagenome]